MLVIGTRLEHYEVLGPLGAGGMGEVYRASDTKLRREVAIKVLPPQFASDAGRLTRFEREAQALAALNHPNIAAVHGMEHVDGVHFLVMELVEGQTIAEKLAARRMEVSEALKIAVQIAEAVQAAHDKGIVHRDLKPANMKVTPEGKVKVLDFGLAKALGDPDTPAADPVNSPTLTMGETKAGIVLGTAAYMSPEQASGQPVDKRADVWAFGVVLYEMLAGKKAFEGKTTSHILVKVIESDPDWSALPPLPGGVQDLLERCLQKDANKRVRDIGDLGLQLQSAITKPLALQAGPSKKRTPWLWPGIAAAAVIAGVLGFLYLRPKAAPAPDAMRFEIAQPGNVTASNVLTISPDGRRLAFLATLTGRSPQIWVRSMETLDARPLEGTEGVNGIPFWSADSRYIVFGAQGKLKKIEASGGPAQSLADISSLIVGGMWTRDNRIIYGELQRGLLQVGSAGGTPSPFGPEPLTAQAGLFPSPLPDGHVAFCRCVGTNGESDGGIYVGSLDGKDLPKKILPDTSPTFYSPSPDSNLGYLLFVRGAATAPQSSGTLMAQPIRTSDLTPNGDAFPIADNVAAVGFSVSSTGVLVYSMGAGPVPLNIPGILQGQLTWFDREGRVTGTIGDPGVFRIPTLSPDGKIVALEMVDLQSRNMDVWLFELARGVNTRFTFGAGREYTPLWSPDGKNVIFAADAQSGAGWFQKASSGAGKEEIVFKPAKPGAPSSWSPDGRFLLANELTQPAEIYAVDLSAGSAADRKPIPAVSSPFNDVNARFSPDGKWFSYSSNESGSYEIYVRPWEPKAESPAGGGKWMLSKGGGGAGGAVWRRDGKELFYLRDDRTLMAVEVSTGGAFSSGVPKELFKVPAPNIVFWDVSADGKRFLMPVPAGTAASTPPYKVVLNWTSTIKK